MQEHPTQKLTRRSLIKQITEKTTDLKQCQISKITSSIITEIIDGIIRDGSVKITGFGSFVIKQRAKKLGRNLKTGEPIYIQARKALVFKPSASVKTKIQKTNE